MTRGLWSRAEALAGQARTVLRRAGIEDTDATAVVGAVQARVAEQRGDVAVARRGTRQCPAATAVPDLCAAHPRGSGPDQAHRVRLALGDTVGAGALMREAEVVLSLRPGLGTLVGEAQALRAQLAKRRGAAVLGASSVPAAELRLLPSLSIHLPFAELGAELFVAPTTVRTPAVSIYRKLGAASRGQAVTRAREVGLVEG